MGEVTAEEAAAAEGRAPGAVAPIPPRQRETVRAEGFAPLVGEAEKSGMIDNAEAYKAAAMKRRERTGGGGKVYISAAAEAQAHGVSVQAVNRARAEAETAKGGEFDKGIAEAQITPEVCARKKAMLYPRCAQAAAKMTSSIATHPLRSQLNS